MSTHASQVRAPGNFTASLYREYTETRNYAARSAPSTDAARVPVVFVIDDDATTVRSIEATLRSQGYTVRAFGSAAAFLRSIDAATPGCVLLKLLLPDAAGLDVQTELVTTGRVQPVVFLSDGGTVRAAVQAMKAGAEDFIETPFDEGLLVRAVERALERDRRQRVRRQEEHVHLSRFELLTPRERQVLGHVIAGHLNKQIAARLGTKEKTIKVHRARMMHKMSVRSVAELTRLAGLIGVEPEA